MSTLHIFLIHQPSCGWFHILVILYSDTVKISLLHIDATFFGYKPRTGFYSIVLWTIMSESDSCYVLSLREAIHYTIQRVHVWALMLWLNKNLELGRRIYKIVQRTKWIFDDRVNGLSWILTVDKNILSSFTSTCLVTHVSSGQTHLVWGKDF